MTPLVNAGDQVDVTITITNHFPDTAKEVYVSDEVPPGLQFIAGSSNIPIIQFSELVRFNLDDMEYADVREITYSLKTANARSQTLLIKDMEDGDDGYFEREALDASSNIWNIVSNPTNSGSRAWFVKGTDLGSDQTLRSQPFTVTGDSPTLRFYHKWNTQNAVDAGFLEIAVNGGEYTLVKEEIIRNGYNSSMSNGTLPSPLQYGFTGMQEDFTDTYVDLSSYIEQSVVIRFRYTPDESIVADGELPGWTMDDFEIMDMVSYTTTACVIASNVPAEFTDCTGIVDVFIDTDGIVSSVGILNDDFHLEIFPNPAQDEVKIKITSKTGGKASVGLFSLDGKLIMSENTELTTNKQKFNFKQRIFHRNLSCKNRDRPWGYYRKSSYSE